MTSGADLTFNEDRTETTASYTGTYPAPQPVTVGPHQVDLKFFADAAGQGSQVGSASVAAAVRSDGTLVRSDGSSLGTVQTDATVVTVSLVPGQSVNAGESAQLAFAAADSASQPVAVSTGSAFFTVATGGVNLVVSSSGLAQGAALGDATVAVTVDSVASAAEKVSVVAPEPKIWSFAANTSSIAYDSNRGLIYATVPADDPTYPSSFVAYSPLTGALVKSLSLPVEPYAIALSDDFQYAYVSQNAVGKIVRVDLASFSVGLSFPLAADRVDAICQMQVRPQHPSQLAVSHFVSGGSETQLTIYDGGVPEAKSDGSVLSLAFDGANKLYGAHYGSMKAYTVDDTGPTVTLQNDNAPGYSFASMASADGRLYLNSYGVLDGTTLNILGTFPGRLQSSLVVPDPIGPYAYGLTWGSSTDRVFQTFRKSDFIRQTSLTISGVGASTSAFVRLSSTSFAFNAAGPSKIYVVDKVYLP